MSSDATIQAPPGLARSSASFKGRHAPTKLANLSAQLLNFIAQLGHDPDRIRRLGGAAGVGRQKGALALVAHCEPVRRQLTDGRASNCHGDPVRLLDLGQRGELASLGELAARDASTQFIGYLLIGEFAGPLDHLHPKSRRCLCLIVPKPQR